MVQKGNAKTIEEIRAKIMKIPTDKDSNSASKDLAKKMIENNFKLCTFAELFEKKAGETKNHKQNDPKIEILKHGKATVEVLKQYYRNIQDKNSKLRLELTDLKCKRKQKRFYDKNENFYTEYREKIFPVLMQDCIKKENFIDELIANSLKNDSEKELKKIKRQLEKLKKESDRLKTTEQDIIEIRKKNEVVEAETCRIQVRNLEMENEIRLFDECVLENKIVELQEKIKSVKEEKLKKKEENNNKEEFKNPNDFPTLLDFLDKSKKLKHKKKRKRTSPSRQPSKRRKNKTGSYSQHDKNGKLHKNGSPQFKLLSPKPSRSSRSLKSPDNEKVQVMKSYGLQLKNAENNTVNLCPQPTNEPCNTIQRTFASTNLANISSNGPSLQRQKSVMQMHPSNTDGITTRSRQKMKSQKQDNPTPKRHEDYATDKDGKLLLQRFPSRQLFPKEQETREELSCQSPPKNIQKEVPVPKTNSNLPALPDKVVPSVEIPANIVLERMETESSLEAASVSKQPSVEHYLRPRRNSKQTNSPKETYKKDINQKKVKSPKKDVKKGRGRKKKVKHPEDNMQVDMSSMPVENQMIVDENATITTVDNNSDKIMAVDENPTTENSVDSNAGSSNESSISDSTGSNLMDVDQNAQVQENDTNMQEMLPSAVDEVSMEHECLGNDNIDVFNMEIENVDPNKTAETSIELSNSFERLFGSSPNTSGNLEMNQSFNFDFNSSRELDENDSGGNIDDFFGFDAADNSKDDFFGNGSFKSNEGTADDFF